MTQSLKEKERRMRNVISESLDKPRTVIITGYNGQGEKVTEQIELNGTKAVTSKHSYTGNLPTLQIKR